MSDNPFDAPADALARSVDVVASLRGTRWAVLVVAAFAGLGSLVFVCGGLAVLASTPRDLGPGWSGAAPGMVAFLGVAYLVAALALVAPTWLLFAYARDLGRFLVEPDGSRLLAALEQQRRFWAVAAFLLIGLVVLYVGAILAVMAYGVVAGGA